MKVAGPLELPSTIHTKTELVGEDQMTVHEVYLARLSGDGNVLWARVYTLVLLGANGAIERQRSLRPEPGGILTVAGVGNRVFYTYNQIGFGIASWMPNSNN